MKCKRFITVVMGLVIFLGSFCSNLCAYARSTYPTALDVFQGTRGQGAMMLKSSHKMKASQAERPPKLDAVWYDAEETIYFVTKEGQYILYDLAWNGRAIYRWAKGAIDVELLWMDIPPYADIRFEDMIQSLMEGIPSEHIWRSPEDQEGAQDDAWLEEYPYLHKEGDQIMLGEGEDTRSIFASTLYSDIGGALQINEACVALISQTMGIFLVNPTLLATKLLVADNHNPYENEMLVWFQVANADITIEKIDSDLADTETAVDIRSVYSADDNDTLKALVEKGRAASLTDSQMIRDAVTSYYPRVQETLLFEDEIYAVPFRLSPSHPWYIDKDFWQKAKIKRIPSTMDELFEDLMYLMRLWKEGKIQPIRTGLRTQSPTTPPVFFLWMLEEYTRQKSSPDTALRFDTVDFEKLVDYTKTFYEAYAEVWALEDAGEISREPDVIGTEEGICAGLRLGDADHLEMLCITSPRISDADEPAVQAEGRFLFVDSLSAHKEEAIRFLEFVIIYPYLGDAEFTNQEAKAVYYPGNPATFLYQYLKQLLTCEASTQPATLVEIDEACMLVANSQWIAIGRPAIMETYRSEIAPYLCLEEPWQRIYLDISVAEGEEMYDFSGELQIQNNILYQYAIGEKTREEVIETLNRRAERLFALYQSRNDE